jgi:hypothetical protein
MKSDQLVCPSKYSLSELTSILPAPTQAFVRKCLAEEEATLVHDDASFVIHEDKSPSAMLNAGIDLENQQYVVL